MKEQNNKVIFADQLRAVAVMLVVCVHWTAVFWFSREAVSIYTFSEQTSGERSYLVDWIMPPTFNYGPFGVAIFFLISGFVIPFSLKRTRSLQFLILRAFRIYPAYIVGTLLMLLFAWASSKYWNKEFTIKPDELIANLLLVPAIFNKPSIDMVNWTLAIEIKFYILSALLAKQIRQANIVPIILMSVIIFCACEWIADSDIHITPTLSLSIASVKVELMCVIYMFIGTCFYFMYSGAMKPLNAISSMAVLLLLFIACWPHTQWKGQIPSIPLNYIYGFIAFGSAYLMKSFFRPVRSLDFLSRISYPIYILHPVIGYICLKICMNSGIPYEASLVVAFSVVVILAYAVHIAIEKPSISLGKKILSRSNGTQIQAEAL